MRRRPRSIPPSTAPRNPPHYFTFIYVVYVVVVVCRSSRIIEIQSRMSERALELLALPDGEPKYILDIGCGSGLSGDVIEEHGHMWVGVDISPSMLGSCRPNLSLELSNHVGHDTQRQQTWRPSEELMTATSARATWATACPSVPAPSTVPSGSFSCSSLRMCVSFLTSASVVSCAIMCAAFRPCSGCATRTRRATFHRGA